MSLNYDFVLNGLLCFFLAFKGHKIHINLFIKDLRPVLTGYYAKSDATYIKFKALSPSMPNNHSIVPILSSPLSVIFFSFPLNHNLSIQIY